MTTVEKLLSIARTEVGYTETPPNSNKTKYGKWFGLDGLPWCGIFVSWVFAKAGKPLPQIGFKNGFASCQLALDYFTKKKMVVTDPKPGDLVFYDWNDDNRFDHVGIVFGNLSRYLTTCEGNTSLSSDRNGGSVMFRARSLKLKMIFVRIITAN